MSPSVSIQRATTEPVPDEDDIRAWITIAIAESKLALPDAPELCVRLVDIEEMIELNATYRGKSGPTNVLSFPSDLPEGLQLPLLGDIVICAAVVAAEALEQGKTERAHWAHMTVHGTLHLLGYDHIEESDAVAMEHLETTVLEKLNFPCPYNETLAMSAH